MNYTAATPKDEYFRTKVMTASPEQLQLMLYDGAIRFARQGREALADGRLEVSCEKLLRAQKIVLELNAAMRTDMQPELCRQVGQLYHFIHRRLVEANLRRDLSAADEAIELLSYQRDTWQMLLTRVQGGASPGIAPAAFAHSSQHASLNLAV